MNHEMRRANQQISAEESIEILEKGTSGVLALWDGEQPYAVPLSYVYTEGKIYFHCARTGHKLDAARACSSASFCVVAADEVLPEKYTTAYRSVIAFGSLRILENEEEMIPAIKLLGEKYNPGQAEITEKEIAGGIGHMYMLELSIDRMTGKEGKELMLRRLQDKI